MKSKYEIHLTRRTQNQDYLEIKDSKSFRKFVEDNMGRPGPKSDIERRLFYHLDENSIKERSEEVMQ